jgi:HPt (histidine-containing phosphotransfer) domain-containing protein
MPSAARKPTRYFCQEYRLGFREQECEWLSQCGLRKSSGISHLFRLFESDKPPILRTRPVFTDSVSARAIIARVASTKWWQLSVWGHGEVGNTSDDLDFEARYEALRTAYFAALPQRRAEAAEYWRACMQDVQAPAWRELHTLVHRLSGSAPCYGLDEIGLAAQKLDRMLSGKPPSRDVAALAPWLDCLLAAMDAVLAAA